MESALAILATTPASQPEVAAAAALFAFGLAGFTLARRHLRRRSLTRCPQCAARLARDRVLSEAEADAIAAVLRDEIVGAEDLLALIRADQT